MNKNVLKLCRHCVFIYYKLYEFEFDASDSGNLNLVRQNNVCKQSIYHHRSSAYHNVSNTPSFLSVDFMCRIGECERDSFSQLKYCMQHQSTMVVSVVQCVCRMRTAKSKSHPCVIVIILQLHLNHLNKDSGNR